MALVEFSFTSWAAENLPPAARLRIARQARQFNTYSELTGELRFERGRFWQVIEGPCELVLPLSSRILTDPRHGDITVGAFRAIAARRFAGWNAFGFDAPGLLLSFAVEVQLPAEVVARAPVPAHLRMG